MKRNKIIGLSVALLGAVASVGTAIALYTSGFESTAGVGFGGFTYQKSEGAYTFLSTLNNSDGGYSSGEYTIESGNPALSPTNTSVTFKFQIAATYGTEAVDMVKQDAILGKLSITKSGALASKISMSAYVDGYDDNQSSDAYWHGASSLAVRTLGGSGDTISAHIPTPTSSTASISTAKKLDVHVTLSLGEVTAAELLAADEGAYNLAVSYGLPDEDYGRPYIVGNGTNWTVEDEYVFVPNLAASSFEWCFKNLNSDSDHSFSSFKVLKNKGTRDLADIWNQEKWSQFGAKANNADNIECDPSTTYFVTYKGDDQGGFTVNGTNIYQ